MKHLFTSLFAFCVFSIYAQQSSTGTVQLLPQYTAEIMLDATDVTIQLNGPADRWFALGFNATTMTSGTDVMFYASGSQGDALYDGRITGFGAPQEDATQNWQVLSNSISGNSRQILAKRPLATGDPNDYDFNAGLQNLNIIFSHGASASTVLAYHQGNRGNTEVQFSDITSARAARPLSNLLTLYPNPAKDFVNLYIDGSAQVSSIQIFDTKGSVVRAIPVGGALELLELRLDRIPSGVYLLEVITTEGRAVKRLMIE